MVMATHATKATGKPRRKRTNFARRWWHDHERIAILTALAANEGNVKKTARQTGCPVQTLRSWNKGRRCSGVLQLHPHKKRDLARAFEVVAWELTAFAPEKIETASVIQTVLAMGVAIDKMLALRGLPSMIGDTLDTNPAPDLTALMAGMTLSEREQFQRLIETAMSRLLVGSPAVVLQFAAPAESSAA
jgi:transposase-like protein